MSLKFAKQVVKKESGTLSNPKMRIEQVWELEILCGGVFTLFIIERRQAILSKLEYF